MSFPFVSNSEPLKREWGEESTLILASDKYMVRKLSMKKGTAGGLQMHHFKDESSYILSGSLRVFYELDGEIHEQLFKADEYFRFPTGFIHKVEALEDSVILEITTPHLNDRVRLDEKYGFDPSCCSLPSTDQNQVIHL